MQEKEIRQRLKDDFIFCARNFLFINTKTEGLKPLVLNKAQSFLHEKLEEQRRLTDKVRAVVLKGRQQGCSTYVEARFYHRIIHSFGMQAFILTHKSDATNHIYDIVKRYHDNCLAYLRPRADTKNAKELSFGGLNSGYKVGTAGSGGGVGRSLTVQYFHGSEVAFWEYTPELAKGIMQTIPDLPGTEIILESTANGVGNYFHEMWKYAEHPESDYQAIFLPWFWQDEYSRELSDKFVLTSDEKDLLVQFQLTPQQIAWRRTKIEEFERAGRHGLKAFQQEYPCTAVEAFQTS